MRQAARGPCSWCAAVTCLYAFGALAHAANAAQPPSRPGDTPALDVSVVTFDPGIPENPALHRDLDIFPRIRNIEAKFLPFVLRQSLVETAEWGAVRVVPEPDPAAEVLVSATIAASDGDSLRLQVTAVDALGRVWLDSEFTGDVTDGYAVSYTGPDQPGYRRLYDDIAAALRAARDRLDARELARIAEVSLLRYATEIAPTAFAGFLTTTPDGGITVHRLPAENDPMMARIALVRSTEYVITDAVDAIYRELHTEIASVYDVWRRYRRKVLQYEQEDRRRAADTRSTGDSGSYESIRDRYDNYKYHRITEQEQDKWAVAFDNEVGPIIDAMETKVAELQAWVDAKYAEWRRILEEFHELETGRQG